MKLFTELEPDSYDRIQHLVSKGKYDSVEQFLRVAAQNQLAIEQSYQKSADTQIQSAQHDIQTSLQQVPSDAQQFNFSPPKDPPTRPPFDEDRSERLLFSQYYRFFPLKCALHFIGEGTEKADVPVRLEEAQKYVQDNIRTIRNGILRWEEDNDIKKKDRKSTGLPKTDVKNPERSMRRYLDHYVGRIQTEKDIPHGFGHDMAYLSFDKLDGRWTVCLSPTGREFVQMENPILTNGPTAPTLSDDERGFIVSTIRDELPEEYEFMTYIYDVLGEIEDSYTSKLPAFRDFLEDSPAIGEEPSDNRVRSHVGGAISRMVELGILERGRRRGWYNPSRHPNKFETTYRTQVE